MQISGKKNLFVFFVPFVVNCIRSPGEKPVKFYQAADLLNIFCVFDCFGSCAPNPELQSLLAFNYIPAVVELIAPAD